MFHWMKVKWDKIVVQGKILAIVMDANTMEFIHMNVHP